MWNSPDIDDLQAFPPAKAIVGYALNIRSALMTDDLKLFVVKPATPSRRWGDDMGVVVAPPDPTRPGKLDFSKAAGARPVFNNTVFLVFPDEATARATSLGAYWGDA